MQIVDKIQNEKPPQGSLSFKAEDREPGDPVCGGRLSLLPWVRDDIAGVATVAVETTEPRGIIAVSLAVTPSQRIFDRQVWMIGVARVHPSRVYLALAALG